MRSRRPRAAGPGPGPSPGASRSSRFRALGMRLALRAGHGVRRLGLCPARRKGDTRGVDRRDSMKAIVQDAYGSTDVLELRDIDRPVVGDDEVLVRVRAAGVDHGVWHVMAGLPYPIRLAGFGLRAPKNPVLGADVAGVVEAIGNDVTRFQPGDEVFGMAKGSYAAYARALED